MHFLHRRYAPLITIPLALCICILKSAPGNCLRGRAARTTQFSQQLKPALRMNSRFLLSRISCRDGMRRDANKSVRYTWMITTMRTRQYYFFALSLFINKKFLYRRVLTTCYKCCQIVHLLWRTFNTAIRIQIFYIEPNKWRTYIVLQKSTVKINY